MEYKESVRINGREVKDPLGRFFARMIVFGTLAAIVFVIVMLFTVSLGFTAFVAGIIGIVALYLVIPHLVLRKLGRRGFFVFGRNDNGSMTVDVDLSRALEELPPTMKK